MTRLAESRLTVKEAAFVTGVGERIVNHGIDARIIPSQLSGGDRRIRGFDVLYLSAVRNVRDGLGQPFRRRLRNAIAKAAAEQAAQATVEHFHVLLQELEVGLLTNRLLEVLQPNVDRGFTDAQVFGGLRETDDSSTGRLG